MSEMPEAQTQQLLATVQRFERQSRRVLPFAAFALTIVVLGILYSTSKLFDVRAELRLAEEQLRQVEQRRREAAKIADRALVVPEEEPADVATGKYVYVGSYNATAKRWETKYLDFSGAPEPEALQGRELKVSQTLGGLNVRSGIPDANGILPPSIDVLSPGETIEIDEMVSWGSSFWFAKLAEIPKG